MTDKNNESALLLRMNKEEQVSVLQEIGFTSVNENTPASDIAKYIRWAGGLLDLSFATIRIEDGVNVFFTAEEWNSLSANNRSKYLRIGVRIRADRRQFVIAKSDCTDDIGGRTFKWGAYGTDIRGVKNYGNGNQGLYETTDGKQNTDAIIEATAGVKDNSGVVGAPAAEAAKSYKACTLELDGLEDKTEWYLPSEGELIIIAKYKTEINENEKNLLKAGGFVRKEIELNNGRKFTTILQVNAIDKGVEFVPRTARIWQEEQRGQKRIQGENRVQSNGQDEKKNNRQWTDENGNIKPIGKWKGVELTEQQKADYISGKTVRLENVPDKQGNPATIYIKFNKEKGRPFRYDTDPDKGQAIALSNESRTQVAVNNEGKTNEATKHVKEPLKQGQTAPADARQQEQQQQGRRQSRSASPKL